MLCNEQSAGPLYLQTLWPKESLQHLSCEKKISCFIFQVRHIEQNTVAFVLILCHVFGQTHIARTYSTVFILLLLLMGFFSIFVVVTKHLKHNTLLTSYSIIFNNVLMKTWNINHKNMHSFFSLWHIYICKVESVNWMFYPSWKYTLWRKYVFSFFLVIKTFFFRSNPA